ncbi:hypothetical protein LX69_00881 [Breznakibacter xylanolyticus]|uniref:SpoIIAA-like protein n=1 Tax=Breznakibacter xylanolyticus TaxID=990 RepID=A0A2W7NRJ1_9BACT|nr:hypothetical protein [Breznakibacter xylanolyticus]PZX19214.1 hypothetical protein LX69_00881 [Breznakibacter xylanolyticus]
MYQIEKTHYGVRLTFAQTISKEEMSQWVLDSEKFLEDFPSEFGVFVDMRDLKPLTREAEQEMNKGQRLFKEKGMIRSVVILNSAIVTMQFKRIAQETGIYDWERYINAKAEPNWQKMGENWLTKAIDPDKFAPARPSIVMK